MKNKSILTVARCLISAALVSAANPAYAQFSDFFSKISKGTGELVDNIGSSTDDSNYVDRALQKVMTDGHEGDSEDWKNPKNGNQGTLTLLSSTSNPQGKPCWKFTRTLVAKSSQSKFEGMACNTADDPEDQITANWELVGEKNVSTDVAEQKALPPSTAAAPRSVAAAIPRPARPSNASVQNAQQLLNWLGYQTGNPDGLMGKRTKNAIFAFQRDYRLPSTGRVDPYLLHHLNGAVAKRHQQQREQRMAYPPSPGRHPGVQPGRSAYPPVQGQPAYAPPPNYATPRQRGQQPRVRPAMAPNRQLVQPAATTRIYGGPTPQTQQPHPTTPNQPWGQRPYQPRNTPPQGYVPPPQYQQAPPGTVPTQKQR